MQEANWQGSKLNSFIFQNDVDAFFDPVADSLADNNPHANYPIW